MADLCCTNVPKILIVDDSYTVRAHLRDFLEPHGFDVLEARDGAEGLTKAEQEDPDLLVVDVNMPVMNGIDCVAAVREIDAHRSTPIFMLTTETSAAMAARAKTAGATAWMVKPCNLEVLLNGIRAVLEARAVA